jgi:hypothetical protein
MIQGATTMTITDTQPIDGEASDEFDEFDDESWLASSHPKGMRVRMPLAALAFGVVLAFGLWGGAKLQASQNPAPATAPIAAGGAGRGGGAGTGAGGGGNGAGGGLTGTVASVQGTTIQVKTANGSTVTVTLLPSTTITRTAAAPPTDITAGETISVRGQTGSNGTTTAQSVAIVPASTTGG